MSRIALLFASIFSVALFPILPLRAEKIYRYSEFVSLQAGVAELSASPRIEALDDQARLRFATGVGYLERYFGGRGLPARVHYWIAADDAELRQLLIDRSALRHADEQALAERLGIFVNGNDVFLRLPAEADPAGALQTALHDLARRYVVVAAGDGLDHAAWFGAGLAQTLSARALGAQDEAAASSVSTERWRTQARLQGDRPLLRIERRDDWRRAVQSEPQQALATAALAVAFLERQSGVSAPRSILEQLAKGVPFDQAFERASGMRLFEFEQRLRREFGESTTPAGRDQPV